MLDFDPRYWKSERSVALERDPIEAASVVQSLPGECFVDFDAILSDAIGDSIRPDVKCLLSDLRNSIQALEQSITSAVEKLRSLPDSI